MLVEANGKLVSRVSRLFCFSLYYHQNQVCIYLSTHIKQSLRVLKTHITSKRQNSYIVQDSAQRGVVLKPSKLFLVLLTATYSFTNMYLNLE